MFDEQVIDRTELRSGDTQGNILPSSAHNLPTFRVENVEDITDVCAKDYQNAANIVAKRIYGRNAYAKRVKGIPYYEDMAGYFQAFVISGDKPVTRGDAFYLQRLYSTHNQIAKAANAG